VNYMLLPFLIHCPVRHPLKHSYN